MLIPTNPFTKQKPMILPSILAADFARLKEDLEDALQAGGDFPHIDVMDGHFVPNLSIGVPIVEKLRKATNAFFDVHLMIDEPVRYSPSFVKAGANNITFHVEAPEVKDNPKAAAEEIRKLGCHVGICVKPNTPIEAVFPTLDAVDLILIMSVEPGFGGQKFMLQMLEKARTLKPKLKDHQRIQIDGGIDPATIAQARQAGIDWFVVGSAIFGQPDYAAVISAMKKQI